MTVKDALTGGGTDVVAVGDTDTAQLEELIKLHFSPLQAKTAEPACPDFGRVAESGTEAVYLYEADLGHTHISFESVWNVEPKPNTKDESVFDFEMDPSKDLRYS